MTNSKKQTATATATSNSQSALVGIKSIIRCQISEWPAGMQMAKVVQLLGELARITAVAANQPVVGGNKKYDAMTDITIITRRDDRYYASWHHNATGSPQSSYWSLSSPSAQSTPRSQFFLCYAICQKLQLLPKSPHQAVIIEEDKLARLNLHQIGLVLNLYLLNATKVTSNTKTAMLSSSFPPPTASFTSANFNMMILILPTSWSTCPDSPLWSTRVQFLLDWINHKLFNRKQPNQRQRIHSRRVLGKSWWCTEKGLFCVILYFLITVVNGDPERKSSERRAYWFYQWYSR